MQHKISLRTAVLLNMNIMIGSGIFISPSQIALIAGNASFLAWPAVVLLFLPLVLCTVQLSKMFPGCGGFYAYAKEGLGTAAGFTSGWSYVMGYIFCIAVDIMALHRILAVALRSEWLAHNPTLFYLGSLIIFILINLLGLKFLAKLLDSMTIAKTLPLIILVILLPFVFTTNFTVSAAEVSMVPLSLTFAMFSFLGFEACCSVSHLIENAEKNAPRAILLGFVITAVIYTLFHLGLLQVMGLDNLTTFGAAGYVQFLDIISLSYVKALLAFLVSIVVIGTIVAGSIGVLNANAIMMHSLAQENIFKGSAIVGKTTSHGRPWAALCIQGVIIFALLSVLPNMDVIGGLCTMAVFLAFILPLLSLLLLEKQRRALHRLPLTIIALLTAVGLSGYSWFSLGSGVIERCLHCLPFAAVMLLGYVLYTGHKKRA